MSDVEVHHTGPVLCNALVLVDVQQLFLAAREENGPLGRIDFGKLKSVIEEAAGPGSINFIAYVLGSPFHDAKQFIKMLKNLGFATFQRFARVKDAPNPMDDPFGGITFENNSWATTMVFEACQMLPTYDEIFIVSGNGQFCKVAELAKKTGKKITVVSFNSSLQGRLSQMADRMIILDGTYLYQKRK